MASLGKKYVAGDVETKQRDFEDLPAGILRLEIEATEIVETGPENNRTGNGMKYTASVLDPEEVAGRKFFGFINLENANPTAQQIGQEEFACLRRACGVDEIDDTEELHFRPYTVKLGMGKPSKKTNADGTPQYPARMEVKKYFFDDEGEGGHAGRMPEPAVDDVQPAAAKPVAANQNARPAANQNVAAKPAGAKPWGKKAA